MTSAYCNYDVIPSLQMRDTVGLSVNGVICGYVNVSAYYIAMTSRLLLKEYGTAMPAHGSYKLFSPKFTTTFKTFYSSSSVNI